jgi:hypothetical protein
MPSSAFAEEIFQWSKVEYGRQLSSTAQPSAQNPFPMPKSGSQLHYFGEAQGPTSARIYDIPRIHCRTHYDISIPSVGRTLRY